MAPNNYWMKLWFEILRDPKMGRLPDRLWRRVIELFLIAGEYGEGGVLPPVEDIAWTLNKTPAIINNDLNKIAETGIVYQADDGAWVVTNFKKRNAPVTARKRVSDYRTRQKENECYKSSNENVTERNDLSNVSVTKRNVKCNEGVTKDEKKCNALTEEQKNRLTEEQKNRLTEEIDDEDDAREREVSEIFKCYEAEIGVITPAIRDEILMFFDDGVSEEWFAAAFRESAANNARSWNYARAILKRWQADGKISDSRSTPRKGNNAHAGSAKSQESRLEEWRVLTREQQKRPT